MEFQRRSRTSKKGVSNDILSLENQFTICDRVVLPLACNKICTKNADVDAHATNGSPPPNQVTDEVDLLLAIVLCPETDTTEKEWPVDRSTSVRMGGSQTGVVLQHEELEFAELLEEVQRLGCLDLDVGQSVVPVGICKSKSKINKHKIGMENESVR